MIESAMSQTAALATCSEEALTDRGTTTKLSVSLPAEIILEVLTILAQQGQEHAFAALHVSKAFYPAIAKYYHFKVHWRNMDGFQSILNKQRKRLEKATFDLRVKAEDEMGAEPAYCMDQFLQTIAKTDFEITEVTFMDLYTRLYAYAVPLNVDFASSIKSLTCIESGQLTALEKAWSNLSRFTFYQEGESAKGISGSSTLPVPSIKIGFTCFSSCTELWWQVSKEMAPGSGRYEAAFTFPALEYLYVVVPKSEHQPHLGDYGPEDSKIDRLFIDDLPHFSNLRQLHKTLKVAFIILWDEEVPTNFEEMLQKKFVWVVKEAVRGTEPYYIKDGYYSRAAVAAFHSPRGEVLNSPEGKAKIRAMLHDEWEGMDRAYEEAQERIRNGEWWI